MFLKKLLSFTEDQKIDIAAQKLQLGEFQEAYTILRDIINKQHNRNSLSFKLALSIFSKSGIRYARSLEQYGHYNEALDIYLSINKVAPHFPDIYNYIANIKLILSDYYSAGEFLLKALELNPRYKEAILNMIKVLIMQEQFQDSLKYCNILESIVTENETEFIRLLKENILKEDKEGILQSLRDIENLQDDYTTLYLRLGIELFNKQRYKEAALELQKYLQHKPKYADILHILGVCYMEIKDYGSAIDSFLNCLSINSDFILSRLHLAMSYKEIGKTLEAMDELGIVLQKDPDNKIAQKILNEIKEA